MTAPKPPSFSPRTDTASTGRRVRDPYADLLRDTRGLRRDQAAARDAWYAGLAVEQKEDLLFELEMLLKGLAAWGNPRNHPGASPRPALSTRDFHPHLVVVRASLARCSELCLTLLGTPRRVAGFGRYLPLGFSEEPRAEGARDTPTTSANAADNPEDALSALRHALLATTELVDGLLQAAKVPYRLFYAAVAMVQREVTRNAFFNPLLALEFRPEFDRMRVPEVLDAIQSVEGDAAHRLVALAYLGMFRQLRMTQLLLATCADTAGVRRAYALLAAMRTDTRALSRILRARTGALLADALERDLMRVSAHEIRARFETLTRDCERLVRIHATLTASGAAMRAAMRRAVERRVPACEQGPTGAELAQGMTEVVQRLRETLQGSVLQLTWALRGSADAERIFSDRGARRAMSERLRQGAWMFSVVSRAFVAKARVAADGAQDVWDDIPSRSFIETFVDYFRALGQVLAVEAEYPQHERLASAVQALRDVDYVDPTRLRTAVAECEAFQVFLQELIERLGRRDELKGQPFSRQAAAETLQMHLAGAE